MKEGTQIRQYSFEQTNPIDTHGVVPAQAGIQFLPQKQGCGEQEHNMNLQNKAKLLRFQPKNKGLLKKQSQFE